jgi:DNA-binding MurR/RpiR family transcriptional regulator
MSDDLEGLSLAEADKLLRTQIEEHRDAMSELGRRRAALIGAAVQSRGRSGVAEVAELLGLSQSAVRRVLVEAKKLDQS